MVRVVALVVLMAVGCGSGSGGNGAASAQAKADCNNFIDQAYCPRIVECLGLSLSDCEISAHGGLDCSTVVGENPGLAMCENQLANVSCADFYSAGTVVLPPACRGLFLTQ